MRTCLIAPVPPYRGGIAKYCHSLATELERRHDLKLLSYQRQYPRLLYGRKSQVDPDMDRDQAAGEFRRLTFALDSVNPLSWRRACREIAEFRPDLVILPWWVAYWTPLYLYLLRFLDRQGITVVLLCINVFEHESSPLKAWLTKVVLKRARLCLVHSEQERKQILGVNPRAKVVKHLLPLFSYLPQEMPRKERCLNLLFFGFVRSYKGLDTLLEALALLKGHEVRLRIAGEFWQGEAECLAMIRKLKLEDRVDIQSGYLSEAELNSSFSRADVVVLPYKKALTSGVIATAYGHGKPVLATRVGSFPEIIRDGSTGKLIPCDDPQALADAILWFLEHRDIDFAGQIREFTAREMSWPSLVDAIEELADSQR